ncbi:hypothetical protein [Streptomyces sp. NPDC014623]|uniref:hypothetical protein n=1 Tax=Streptomyces sp. NPDC014623 TaxID=3364875 RepID=UPI0037026813
MDETAVANAAKEFADAGRRALALLCGPTDEDQAAAAVDRTVETFGRLGTACTALGHHCDH